MAPCLLLAQAFYELLGVGSPNSKYLGKSDLEFDQRLTLAKKNMPELFEE